MDRQRSFTFKSRTRFTLFFFTISSSLLFFSFFSICVFQKTPLLNIPIQISFNFGLKPIKVQSFTDLGRKNLPLNSTNGVSNSTFSYTHFRKPHNSSLKLVEVLLERGNFDEVKKKSGSYNGKFVNNSSLKNFQVLGGGGECDESIGKWVFDESYPLYNSSSCPFIDEGFSCQVNGRLNSNYLKWRWQPYHCNIPRFNAVKMLELIRGKRLVFVGDSINRNQWESMLCLLMGAIKDPKRVYETHGRKITKGKGNYSFKFMDYQCTVEYYVTHFLVHESKARVGRKRYQTLRIDTIDKGSSRWKGADILVFNTAHWWSHFKTKSGVNYYQEGNGVLPHLDVSTAFRRALTTWALWVDKNIKPGKTQVFFRSSSPSHFRGGEWNAGGHCKEATQPLNYTWNSFDVEKNIIAEQVIKKMKTPTTLLNITSLSEFRIDGHPSIYGKKPAAKGLRSGSEDCSHWCLPGVPDTWNELLYFHLQSKENIDSMM